MIEKTLVIIKPDAIERKLVGEIIKRFEQVGLEIVAMKMVKLTKEQAMKFYPSDEEWLKNVGKKSYDTYVKLGLDIKKEFGTDNLLEIGKKIKEWLAEFMSSNKIIAIVLKGNNAIEVVRKIVGSTKPIEALPGTIRGDFSCDSPDLANYEKRAIKNLVHASDSKETAEREIKFFFNESEIFE